MRQLFLLALVVLVVLVVLLWRNRWSRPVQRKQTPPPPSSQPQEMVACAQCGVLLPSSEGVVGKTGTYCCAEHMNASET